MEEKVTVFAKRKSIQTVFDYCLDHKIAFMVSPRGISTDEFEMDLIINGIKQAVALGMFAKEHKFEVSGLGEFAKVKNPTSPSKKGELKENGNQPEESPAASLLNL
ncbi:MAG: hypothetical protein MUE96_01490 [Bacteroidia bacterium]|jgi:hypothetical protein|nr:hypothetical protein [Bacteroidia bacterium]